MCVCVCLCVVGREGRLLFASTSLAVNLLYIHSLSDGLQPLSEGLNSLSDGLHSLTDGLHSLSDGLHSLSDECLRTTRATVACKRNV